MKSLLKLLREEDKLTERFNEKLFTMILCANNIKDIKAIDHDCQAKTDDIAHYQSVAAKAKTRANEIAQEIVCKRAEISETINADRVTNVLLLDKEIENIMLKG